MMKNITISNEEEGICFFSGMVLEESDIDTLERILSRLPVKTRKTEKRASAPEGIRLNRLEHSLDTLLKAQVKTNKILEETQNDILVLSKRLDLDIMACVKLDEAIEKNHNLIDHLAGILARDQKAARKRNKRISDIEEFLGDL